MELSAWLLGIGAAVVAGLAIWMVQRSATRVDAMEERIHSIELRMVQELPSKSDLAAIASQVQTIQNTMTEVRDWMIRMDEREKVRT